MSHGKIYRRAFCSYFHLFSPPLLNLFPLDLLLLFWSLPRPLLPCLKIFWHFSTQRWRDECSSASIFMLLMMWINHSTWTINFFCNVNVSVSINIDAVCVLTRKRPLSLKISVWCRSATCWPHGQTTVLYNVKCDSSYITIIYFIEIKCNYNGILILNLHHLSTALQIIIQILRLPFVSPLGTRLVQTLKHQKQGSSGIIIADFVLFCDNCQLVKYLTRKNKLLMMLSSGLHHRRLTGRFQGNRLPEMWR